MPDCHTCELLTNRDSGTAPLWDNIYRTDYWDVVHCNATSLLGWMILVIRRHIASVDELTEDEALELGKFMRQVSIILKELTGCQKTYVVQFAEAPGHQHVHFHIIPRAHNLPEADISVKIFKYLGVPSEDRLSDAVMNEFAEKVRKRMNEMNG